MFTRRTRQTIHRQPDGEAERRSRARNERYDLFFPRLISGLLLSLRAPSAINHERGKERERCYALGSARHCVCKPVRNKAIRRRFATTSNYPDTICEQYTPPGFPPVRRNLFAVTDGHVTLPTRRFFFRVNSSHKGSLESAEKMYMYRYIMPGPLILSSPLRDAISIREPRPSVVTLQF